MSKEWLSQLKEGDKVVVYSYGWGNSSYNERVVEKITPKGFIKVNGSLFNPNDGYRRGDGGACLQNPNDNEVMEKVKKYRKDMFISKILRDMWETRCLTYEQAIEIDRILGDEEK